MYFTEALMEPEVRSPIFGASKPIASQHFIARVSTATPPNAGKHRPITAGSQMKVCQQ